MTKGQSLSRYLPPQCCQMFVRGLGQVNVAGSPPVKAERLSSVRGYSHEPVPAALPLFATVLGALGLLGWRRKRKAQAA
jgi:hypothetical protein